MRDDFGQLIVGLLSSAHALGKGPSLVARPDPPEGSSFTSLASSPRTVIENSSTLEPVHSYSDVVPASSPVIDVKIEQESIVALDTGR